MFPPRYDCGLYHSYVHSYHDSCTRVQSLYLIPFCNNLTSAYYILKQAKKGRPVQLIRVTIHCQWNPVDYAAKHKRYMMRPTKWLITEAISADISKGIIIIISSNVQNSRILTVNVISSTTVIWKSKIYQETEAYGWKDTNVRQSASKYFLIAVYKTIQYF